MKSVSSVDIEVAQDTIEMGKRRKVCMNLMISARFDNRVARDAVALVEAGFDVCIVDVEEDPQRPAEEFMKGIKLKHIISPRWFIPTRFKPWFLVKFALMMLRSFIQLWQVQADIYHAQVEKAMLPCYIIARLRRKPIIFTCPDLVMDEPNVKRWRRLRGFSIRLFAHMTPRCAGVITTSPLYAQEIQKLYRASDLTLLLNVPYYTTVQKSDRLKQRLGLGPETRVALYQGNLQADRTLDVLVRAAAHLEKNTVIVMMGNSVKSEADQLQHLIADENVADRVFILPPVPHVELLEWTSSADIGLIVYRPDRALGMRYTLPNKLFEYLMVGLPILSSKLDAIGDLLKTYGVGQIVDSVAPVEIARAIQNMLDDRPALERMRENALKVAHEEFYWEKESKKLVQLYHKILEIRQE